MAAGALLELDGITKRFGGVLIAEDLSLSVGAGDAIGLVGPNGAGKTTVFGIVAGDVAPDRGQVRLDGRSVTHLSSAARCRLGIGRTYQIPRPFEGMTVFENVLVAAHQGAGLKKREAYELASGTLDATGLASMANRFAGSLGLLHRKRLEVARALATRPRVLLLDEVASGLTDLEVGELVRVVRQARDEGIAVVWVEHAVRTLLTTVERLICLAGGHVLGDGAPRDVLAMASVREVYLGSDVEVGAPG